MVYTDNQFLDRLPPEVLGRLSHGFDWLELSAGDTSFLDNLDHLLFPVQGLVSFLATSSTGVSFEVALAGLESLIGICIFLNCKRPILPAVVRRPLVAVRLPAKLALEEFRLGTQFQHQVLSYMRVFFTQVARISVCNSQHSLEQRFCRWLLLSQDRLKADERVSMSQESIAGKLGVRREAITRVASQLRSRNLIDYTTRRIEIVDEDGLRAAACDCYEHLRFEFEELDRSTAPGHPW